MDWVVFLLQNKLFFRYGRIENMFISMDNIPIWRRVDQEIEKWLCKIHGISCLMLRKRLWISITHCVTDVQLFWTDIRLFWTDVPHCVMEIYERIRKTLFNRKSCLFLTLFNIKLPCKITLFNIKLPCKITLFKLIKQYQQVVLSHNPCDLPYIY